MFYKATSFRIPRMREIVLCSVGMYLVKTVSFPPNPPPDLSYLVTAIDGIHRYVQSQNTQEKKS
jgi:hypothetical protein